MTTGWIIGVLVDMEDDGRPSRLFYAVAQPDRARAEWAAADRAMLTGAIASSPRASMEPVEAMGELDAHALGLLGLKAGQIKPLGEKWPRRWLVKALPADHDERD